MKKKNNRREAMENGGMAISRERERRDGVVRAAWYLEEGTRLYLYRENGGLERALYYLW